MLNVKTSDSTSSTVEGLDNFQDLSDAESIAVSGGFAWLVPILVGLGTSAYLSYKYKGVVLGYDSSYERPVQKAVQNKSSGGVLGWFKGLF